MTNLGASGGLCWHEGQVVFVICISHLTCKKKTWSHNQINTNTLNTHKHTNTHEQTHTHTLHHYNQLNVGMWQVLRIQVDGPFKRGWVVFVIFLPPLQIVNMTSSPSLLTNGRQLESSELVISHCLMCPVKMSTELFINLQRPRRLIKIRQDQPR